MKKRHNIAYNSPSIYTSNKAQREVYNVFPFIQEPLKRGYYLPTIDAIYLPCQYNVGSSGIQEELGEELEGILLHEQAHSAVADAAMLCELRVLVYRLLAGIIDAVMDEDSDVRVLVPSFTIVKDGEKDYELKNLADKIDLYFVAMRTIQEITAAIVQARMLNLDRSAAKALMQVSIDNRSWTQLQVENSALAELLLDKLISIAEELDTEVLTIAACAAFNTKFRTRKPGGNLRTHEVERQLLNEFQNIIEHLVAYLHSADNDHSYLRNNLKLRRKYGARPKLTRALVNEIITRKIEVGRFTSRFERYLMECVPSFPGIEFCPHWNETLCEGCSLPWRLQGQDWIFRSTEARDVLYDGAWLMGRIRCDDEGSMYNHQHTRPAILLGLQEINDRRSVVQYLGFSEVYLDQDLTPYTRIEESEGQLISYRPMESEFFRVQRETAYRTVMWEAIWQQLWTADGPRCLCYPRDCRHDECYFCGIVDRLWDRTEPDPRRNNLWKRQALCCTR